MDPASFRAETRAMYPSSQVCARPCVHVGICVRVCMTCIHVSLHVCGWVFMGVHVHHCDCVCVCSSGQPARDKLFACRRHPVCHSVGLVGTSVRSPDALKPAKQTCDGRRVPRARGPPWGLPGATFPELPPLTKGFISLPARLPSQRTAQILLNNSMGK